MTPSEIARKFVRMSGHATLSDYDKQILDLADAYDALASAQRTVPPPREGKPDLHTRHFQLAICEDPKCVCVHVSQLTYEGLKVSWAVPVEMIPDVIEQLGTLADELLNIKVKSNASH